MIEKMKELAMSPHGKTLIEYLDSVIKRVCDVRVKVQVPPEHELEVRKILADILTGFKGEVVTMSKNLDSSMDEWV